VISLHPNGETWGRDHTRMGRRSWAVRGVPCSSCRRMSRWATATVWFRIGRTSTPPASAGRGWLAFSLQSPPPVEIRHVPYRGLACVPTPIAAAVFADCVPGCVASGGDRASWRSAAWPRWSVHEPRSRHWPSPPFPHGMDTHVPDVSHIAGGQPLGDRPVGRVIVGDPAICHWRPSLRLPAPLRRVRHAIRQVGRHENGTVRDRGAPRRQRPSRRRTGSDVCRKPTNRRASLPDAPVFRNRIGSVVEFGIDQ